MNFNNDLPIVLLDVDVKDMYSGMVAISFVDEPATEVNWTKFNTDKPKLFKKDEYKRCVTGPIMLCDTPIYRYDESIGEYYCKFNETSLFNMMFKYVKEGKNNIVNEMHNSRIPVNNVYLIEHYFVNDKVTSNLYPEIKSGSVMGTFYIDDQKYWDNVIMKDKFKGFSLEGFFDETIEKMASKKIYEKMKSEVLSDSELEEFVKWRINKILDSDLSDFHKEAKIKSLLNLG